MITHVDMYERIQAMIPPDLWQQYAHLSFAEMAQVPALAEWRDALLAAETEWFQDEEETR